MGPDVQNTVAAPPGGLEREVFGKWTVMLRNLVGTLSVATLCFVAILNAYTIHLSVSNGKDWPDNTALLIIYIGNVIIAWTWINANKTLETLLSSTSLSDKIRGRVAGFIEPKDKTPPSDV